MERARVLAVTVCLCLWGVAFASYEEFGARQGKLKPTQFLKSYQGFVNDFYRKNDAYRMEYNVGDSSRFEQRTDSGEVSGTYAFVAPEGDEYEFKYEADDEGFKVEGDALPQAVEETDDVKAAKEAFFEAYERQLELAGDDSYEYDDDSDESDEDDKYDDESSEESSEEDSSEEDDDDDDSDERSFSRFNRFNRRNQRAAQPAAIPYPYSRRS